MTTTTDTTTEATTESNAGPSTPQGVAPRFKTRYREEILPALTQRFGYSTPMRAPRIVKVTVNMGVGDAKQDSKMLEAASEQLATITAPEPRMLTVQPYDKSSIKAIERAILESDVGLTPSNDGNLIRLGIPELTEERRKQLVKVVRHIAEEGRVAIRNIRRDVMHDLRELKEAGEAGSDDEHRAELDLQKVTDARIGELDELLKHKEEEILEV